MVAQEVQALPGLTEPLGLTEPAVVQEPPGLTGLQVQRVPQV